MNEVEMNVAAALDKVHAFIAAMNSRDTARWADSMLYPHVWVADSQLNYFENPQQLIAAISLDALTATGWDHSSFDNHRVIHASADKLHLGLSFSRYDTAGKKLSSSESLYVFVRRNQDWGIQIRSDYFGPVSG